MYAITNIKLVYILLYKSSLMKKAGSFLYTYSLHIPKVHMEILQLSWEIAYGLQLLIVVQIGN